MNKQTIPKARTIIEVALVVIVEVVLLLMYGLFVRYFHPYDYFYDIYAAILLFCIFMMLILGFGMLLTYNKANSAIGLFNTVLILSFTIQVYFLINLFFTRMQIQPSTDTFARGDQQSGWLGTTPLISRYGVNFSNTIGCALTVLVSYIALHGSISSQLLLVHTVVTVICFEINRQTFVRLHIKDNGGSMGVFLLGSLNGFVVSTLLNRKNSSELQIKQQYRAERINYIFAFIGAAFIWCLLPLFSSINQTQSLKDSIIDPYVNASAINTWIALSFGLLWTFLASKLKYKKISLHDLVFGSICGGIAYGSSASLIYIPLGAIIVGVTAALTNTWLVPKIKFLKLKNTSRVGGLTESFIVAGLLGGLFSAIFAFFVSMQTFQDFNPDLFNGNSLKQVGIQLAGVGISTVMSIINGLISGLLLWIMTKKCGYDRSSEEENYQMVCSERPNDVSV